MPEAISAILPMLTAGSAGAGLIGNIMSSVQQGKVASQAEKNANLTPGQLGLMVAGAEQPLDRSLINLVNNQVQGDMASRGLAEAPGIFAASEGQALAPYEQQNQNAALQLIMQKLGLPAETLQALRSGGGGMANMNPLLQMIMKMMGQNSGNDATSSPAQLWNLLGNNPQSTPGLTTPNNWTGPTDTGDGSVPA